MIIFFIVYVVLILLGIKFNRSIEEPLSHNQTNALKGLGIMTVFFNHIYNGYLTPHNALHHTFYDEPFVLFESIFTGLFVGMFLFFSGYGVLESFKKKGVSYVSQMPVKRIGTTLLNFDVAVLVFLIANLFMQITLMPKDVILSFVAWESIGNSNWYIFAILYCYLVSYISHKLARTRKIFYLIICLMMTLYIVIMSAFKQPWWYNTILCYPAGIFYSDYKNRINSFFQRRYFACLFGLALVFILLYLGGSNALLYNCASIVFCFICILLSMRVSLRSKPLIWMGIHLFPLYIYQRLPMFVLEKTNPVLIDNTPTIYVIICIIITLLLGRFVPIIKLGSSK